MSPKTFPRALLPTLVLHAWPAAQAQEAPPDAAPAALPAVVVTAPKKAAEPTRRALQAEQAATPGAVTLVEAEELSQRNVTRLADALRYVPGLWVASGSTADSTYFSARGSNLDATGYDGNGIKLLVDGLPVTAADGNNHNRDVDPLSARYIVVARGANALTYGASTLGGAIDFISPTGRDGAPTELRVSGGSHGQVQGRLTVGGASGAFDGLLSIETQRSDGWREHQRQARTGLYANAGWDLGSGLQTRFYATAIDNEQQLTSALTRAQLQADPSQSDAAAAGNYRYDVTTRRLANKTTWTIDANRRLSVGVSVEEQELYHPIVYAPPFFSLLIDTTQRNLGGMLRYEHRIGQHELLAGLNTGRTRVSGGNYRYAPATGPLQRFATTDNHAHSTEVFAVDRWQFAPGWTAVWGAQAVTAGREVRGAGGVKGDFDSFNPRVGLIRQLTPDAQLFANLSRLYEAPTLYELQDDASGQGRALDAMHGTVVEVGTRGSDKAGRHSWRWDVAMYWAQLQDEILSRDAPQAPGTSLSVNVDRTVHAGIEALLGARLWLGGGHHIEPLLNLTVNHFRFDGDATYGRNTLPAAPAYALKGELLWRHAGGFFAGPTFDLVGRRWADFANTYRVSGYTLWGLRAGFEADRWEVYAEARNLADKTHVSQLSVRDQASASAAILTPGEPRSFYVGARLKF
jgi:iron complex outermembrane receptor protein